LARRGRHRVSVSSSGIIPSRRYSDIGFCQSASGSGSLTIAAISPSGSRFGSLGPAEAHGLTLEVGTGPSFPGGVPGVGIGLSSSGEILSLGTGISPSSRMGGLNKSCANTPGGDGSWLDLSRARALAASLSHRWIWWSSKPSNFSSSFPTSCRYAAMRES
jgi:hypothetical protein